MGGTTMLAYFIFVALVLTALVAARGAIRSYRRVAYLKKTARNREEIVKIAFHIENDETAPARLKELVSLVADNVLNEDFFDALLSRKDDHSKSHRGVNIKRKLEDDFGKDYGGYLFWLLTNMASIIRVYDTHCRSRSVFFRKREKHGGHSRWGDAWTILGSSANLQDSSGGTAAPA